MLSIDLNGPWQLQPDWQSPRIEQLPETLFNRDEWLPAHVPGAVHTDLLTAGKIPDPFYRDNEWQVQWVAEIGWRYRRAFQVSAEFLTNNSIHLVAEGLDTFATILINSQQVAETSNMFIPPRLDVRSWLHAGDNEVEKFSPIAVDFIVEISGPDFRASKHVSSSQENISEEFVIEQPQLWWPHGFGNHPLYAVTVIASVSGEIVDERVTRFGIRKLELLREQDAGGESFLFCINNVRLFCKGADWIPADCFLPRIANEKYRSLLSMADDAHMNMLRVWGGGIYEEKIFYDLCDELGILVWQDFMFACGVYPEYPEFAENVRHEVAIIVRQLRNHPCIALWCGNNENEWIWNMETRRPHREMPGVSLFEKIIPEICAAHDPARPYSQSSPFGGEDPNDRRQGDRHQRNIWSNWADPATVAKDRGRFVSEFGFQAPATCATWEKFLDRDDLWPQSPVFEHHNKQAEGSERLYRFLAGHVKMPDNFEDFVYKTQIVQAEALKTMVQH